MKMVRDSDLKGAVQEQFGPVAANYLTSAVHAQGEDLPVMVQAASLRGDERVLDAGLRRRGILQQVSLLT